MPKPVCLLSPYGEAFLETFPTHLGIRTDSSLAGDWALGWYHGRESGDEAVYSRAFWKGELGTGGKPSAAKTDLDAFIGKWGFQNDLDQETAGLRPGDRARTQAYAQGFNLGRRRRSKEAPWTPEDCHLLARTYGFLEWWETRAPQAAFLLKLWQEGLPWNRIVDLWPGLGAEPDRGLWKSIKVPSPFTPEIRVLVNRIRRFRQGTTWIIPGNRSAGGRPCLAGSYVTDVTDPGLPFRAVRIDSPEKTVRGLSRPGHPGFLAGRTDSLAWHGTPAVDDTVDLRIVDGATGPSLAGLWAGAGQIGTLQSLFFLEEAPTAGWARDRCQDLGSAPLDFTAADRQGGTETWVQGRRWLRPDPRDAWLPAPWGSQVPGGPRTPQKDPTIPYPGRWTPETLGQLLARTQSDLPGEILPVLRFLLPDSDEGQRLRRWTGTPETGVEAAGFTRLFEALANCFWEGSPETPGADGPVFQALLPTVIRLLQAPHSAWFPSTDKNRRLAEAVRKAYSPGTSKGAPVLGRRAPKPCWTEVHGGTPRTFASTVAFTADLGSPDWQVFLSFDETEQVRYQTW